MKISFLLKLAAFFVLLGLLPVSLCSCQWVYITYDGTPDTTATAEVLETRDLSKLPETREPVQGMKYSDFTTRFSEAETAAAALYDQDFSNFTFMVVIAEEATNTLSADETDSMYYPYAMREKLITDKYKNSFYINTLPYETLQAELKTSLKAGSSVGTYFADMLEVPAEGAASLAVSGLLLNLRSLPFYTVSQEGISGAGYINGKSYFNTSAATESLTDTLCLYFNRTLCTEDVSSELYSSVFEGSFTFEKFLTLAAACPAGSNGCKMSSCASLGYTGDLIWARSGFSFTASVSAYPQISEKISAAEDFDTVAAGFATLGVYTAESSGSSAETGSSAQNSADITAESKSAREMFTSAGVPFYIGTLRDAKGLASEKVQWGLLPLPSEEGCSVRIEAKRSVFCVPANNARLEMTGLMLTALDSLPDEWMGDFILAEYAENYLRDNESCKTISAIFEGTSFCDFAYLYGESITNLGAATYGAVRAKAAGTLESVASSGIDIAAVNKAIKKAG